MKKETVLMTIIICLFFFPMNNVFADNTLFYGDYDVTISMDQCDDDIIDVLSIGSDASKRGVEDMYIYIPATAASETYEYSEPDGDVVTVTVSISEKTIHQYKLKIYDWDTSKEETTDLSLIFSNDYSTFTLNGDRADDAPDSCDDNSLITGNGTKIVAGDNGIIPAGDDGDDGDDGWCFINTMQK